MLPARVRVAFLETLALEGQGDFPGVVARVGKQEQQAVLDLVPRMD